MLHTFIEAAIGTLILLMIFGAGRYHESLSKRELLTFFIVLWFLEVFGVAGRVSQATWLALHPKPTWDLVGSTAGVLPKMLAQTLFVFDLVLAFVTQWALIHCATGRKKGYDVLIILIPFQYALSSVACFLGLNQGKSAWDGQTPKSLVLALMIALPPYYMIYSFLRNSLVIPKILNLASARQKSDPTGNH